MRIVCRHQGHPCIACKAHDVAHHYGVLLQPVILKFQEKVALSEQVLVPIRKALRHVVLALHHCFVDVALQARGAADQPLCMLRKQILVDARLVVEPFRVGGGNQLHQIPVTLLGFGQQQQVVIAIPFFPLAHLARSNVHLAADNRPDAFCLGGIVELHRAKQIPVIAHRDGRHLHLRSGINQRGDIGGPIQHGVVGVAVQVNERGV